MSGGKWQGEKPGGKCLGGNLLDSKNLDKSNLDRRFLKVTELGAQTIFSGKEFQGEITRYAKEPLCRFDLRTGILCDYL